MDFLRGVAILMVVICHTLVFRRPGWEAPIVNAGWAGVDLFFVLSGFLISGLLFTEYRRTGAIRFWRFAIRRALKIYPAFYALVFLTVFVRLATHSSEPVMRALLHDIFFVQSYAPGTYGHFWSLSIEEHFYILLPFTLYLMLRGNQVNRADPFRFLPAMFAAVAVALLIARLLTDRYVVPFTWQTHLFPTHLRIDSLFFGVLLSYFANFHEEKFWGFMRPRAPQLLLIGTFLILPLFLISQYDSWMYTYGFTVLYLGFGAILIGLLSIPVHTWPKSTLVMPRALAYVGRYSYSIYLWHIPWLIFLLGGGVIRRPYIGFAVYFIGSLALGIGMSILVEIPSIRLRNRLFPASTTGQKPAYKFQPAVQPTAYPAMPRSGAE